MSQSIPKRILPVIVGAQFACTSLWFAGNAVVPDLVSELHLGAFAVGYITSAVQFGFIIGTLLFAFVSVADRISPSLVFLGCALLGACANALTVYSHIFGLLILSRFVAGFFLAGIYPVGMKTAADWHKEGLGKALGYLVGALVLGTAFPHLLKYLSAGLPWRVVFFATSGFAALGGIILYLAVGDGPYQSKKGVFKAGVIFRLFKDSNFRSAAFGYFGHMWELYTFWAFIPLMVGYYAARHSAASVDSSLWAFIIIAAGSISCAAGGHWALKAGSKKVALYSLIASGLCCLVSPFFFGVSFPFFMVLLLFWGMVVIADSPQFSTLVAASADSSYVATGLTIVNSIGFAITIVSIQLVNSMWARWESPYIFLVMAAGPLLGALAISRYATRRTVTV